MVRQVGQSVRAGSVRRRIIEERGRLSTVIVDGWPLESVWEGSSAPGEPLDTMREATYNLTTVIVWAAPGTAVS